MVNIFYRTVSTKKIRSSAAFSGREIIAFNRLPLGILRMRMPPGIVSVGKYSVFKTLLFLFPISECIRHLLLIRVVRGDKDGIGSGRIGLNFRDDPRIAHMERGCDEA